MKTVVITGCTSGIGYAVTHHLLEQNYVVYGVARSMQKLNAITATLDNASKANFHPIKADFSSLSEVKSAINTLKEVLDNGLDVLINNAAIVPKAKKMTEDGFELQYQVNHLVPVLITKALYPVLKKSDGIVITTSSDAHKRAKFVLNDLDALKKYHAFRSYCRTKLYNVMMTYYFQRHLKDVDFYAVHPGRVKTDIGTKDTSKLYAIFWRLFTRTGFSPMETVPTYMKLIESRMEPGYYYLEKSHTTLDIAKDTEAQNLLMKQALHEINSFL